MIDCVVVWIAIVVLVFSLLQELEFATALLLTPMLLAEGHRLAVNIRG